MSAPILISVDGLFWPADDIEARPVILRDRDASIARMLAHTEGRDTVVQAGGNIGAYPIALAEHFKRVFTFEPHPANYECLKRNRLGSPYADRIHMFGAGLAETHGSARMFEVSRGNCGAHRIAFDKVTDENTINLVTIDGLRLSACDAIWLDIEGAELGALKGAASTIERFSPIIAVEDKGLHRAFDVPDGALQAWLAERGYEQIDKIGQDKVYRRET